MHSQLERMLGWLSKPAQGHVPGKPYLDEQRGILALHFNSLSVQSEMAIDMPDKLVLSYTRAMMSFLLLNPSPKQIAMIGLGGGSLAKYCYRYLPQAHITVFEISQEVIDLRDEFAIPADDARFKVVLGDGAEKVTEIDSQYDVLMVDGFDAEGLPTQLSSPQFYRACFASLADQGILVVNLWGNNQKYPEYLARIHTSFAGQLVVISSIDSLNKIVLAVKSSDFAPSSSTIQRHATLLDQSHPLDFKMKSSKLMRALGNRIG